MTYFMGWGTPGVGPGEVLPGMHKSEAQCSGVGLSSCSCGAEQRMVGLRRMLEGKEFHSSDCALLRQTFCACPRCCHHEWCPDCGYSLLIFEDDEPGGKPGHVSMLTGHFDCRDWRNKITTDRYRSQLAGSPFLRRS